MGDAAPRLRIEGLKSELAGPFDLEVATGECVGITGASGSGKSLFLRMICDLDVNQGEVWLDGVARSGMAAPAWRRQVMYVPAESGWWTDVIADHFPKPLLGAAHDMAARLGLPDGIVDGPVSRLSTGERQRLAMIRALVMASPVLLLDEPTSALDGDGAARIEAILTERLAMGLSLVLVTHDPAQAVRMARRRYVMAPGGHLGAAP
jgi:ABC-type iron transport system FetAB ATPase subunit